MLFTKIGLSTPSTKTKTMVLVLALFILMATLFSALRYSDVKASIEKSRQDYTLQIHNIYHTSLVRIGEFYNNRGLANLDSYGIKEALSHKDAQTLRELSIFRWNVLKQENPFLLGMRFYDDSFSPIVTLGKDSSNRLIPSKERSKHFVFDFVFSKEASSYHIIIPAYEQEKIIGYIEFILLSDYFLNEVEEFSGLKGYVQSPFNKTIHEDEILKHVSFQHGEISYYHNHTYITHAINLQSDAQQCSSNLLFFQDISDQQEKLLNAVYEVFFLSLGLLSVMIIALHYGFEVLIKKLETSESSLRHLNHTLEERVGFEIQKRFENEQMLMHQSRLASMGEMIGNIAHQWRQPLTELGATLVNIGFLWDVKKLNNETFNERLHQAETLIAYMSKTIDDFRNFFATDAQEETFCINDAIHKTLMLLESSLKNHHITLNIDEPVLCSATGFPNQFSQALLNILGNAKDILIERNIANPCIWITLTCKEGKTLIKIEDNGGGITLKPIEKIFEPYVSTKHATSGTGIGLYMTKTIIEKNAKGTLRAYNSSIGAVFEIVV